MSLTANILKVRKAFSNPRVPHNPAYFMFMYDLRGETKLNEDEFSETLEILEKDGVVETELRSDESPAHVTVTEEYRELMGVS